MPLRLNAFAVLAFSAAMRRLPSHWSPQFSPLKATAQIVPSRVTATAHSLFSKPPFSGPPVGFTLFLRASTSWSCRTGQLSFAVDLADWAAAFPHAMHATATVTHTPEPIV